MKKLQSEVWLVIAAILFLVSWLIDKLGGPVSIVVPAPIAFLKSTTLLHTYPFTATSIIIRTLAIFISVMLITSLVRKKYFTKAISIIIVGVLAEFYAIQQLATGSHLATIQWTLSIAYASIILLAGVVWMILKGIWSTFNKSEDVKVTTEEKEAPSVLEPTDKES